jgi:hypothetical protein
MHRIDTTPGLPGPFSPPAGWQGEADAYRDLLRRLYRHDSAARQQIAYVARRRDQVRVTGPHAAAVLDILDTLAGAGR